MNITQPVRFDARFTISTSSGRSQKRASKRTVTTICCGSKAFGNPEMRAIFKKQ